MTATTIEHNRYACPVCGRPNTTLAEKKAHVRREHPRPKKKGANDG